MATVDESSCPACGAAAGALQLDVQLVAKPLGTFSLAGAMPKVSARELPVLTCRACPLRLVGEFDGPTRDIQSTSVDGKFCRVALWTHVGAAATI